MKLSKHAQIITALFGAACFAFAGCKSTKVEVETLGPIAIISITGNNALPWYEIEAESDSIKTTSHGTLQSLLDKKFRDDDPEFTSMVSRLDFAEEAFRTAFSAQLGVDVLPKETLTESKAYSSLKGAFLSTINPVICAADLKDLKSISKSEIKSICAETGAQSVLLLDFEFYKKMKKGNKYEGLVSPHAIMRARIHNAEGAEIYYKSYEETGFDSVPVKSRKYDKNAFVELYQPLTELLANRVILDLLM